MKFDETLNALAKHRRFISIVTFAIGIGIIVAYQSLMMLGMILIIGGGFGLMENKNDS